MAKAKKIVQLGVNVAENLIDSSQWGKLETMIREKRFSPEAVRFILDKRGYRSIYEAMSKYNFLEIYSSFEDYINSKVSKDLYEEGDSECVFHWLGDFPSSSEELMELYNKQDTDFMKKIIFKNSVYRNRNFMLNSEIREKYINCFDGLLEIVKEQYNQDTMEALNYLFVWSSCISEDWAYKAEKLVGREEAIKLMTKRADMRHQNFNCLKGLEDAKEIFHYLSAAVANPTIDTIPVKYLLNACSPFEWQYGMNAEEKVSYRVVAKEVYDTFLKHHVDTDIKEVYRIANSNGSKVSAMVYAFETDEELVDKAFSLACKKEGIMTAINDIIYLTKNKIDVNITTLMEKISEVGSNNWKNILLTKELKNAEDVLKFKDRVFPFDHYIDPFGENPFVVKNLRLEAFDKADVDALAAYIDWSHLAWYFEKNLVPFEFLMAHRDKIKGKFEINHSMLKAYTGAQITEVIDIFGDRTDEHALAQMTSYCLTKKDGLTAADAAKLLQKVKYVELASYEKSKNSKLDLQSILTLI